MSGRQKAREGELRGLLLQAQPAVRARLDEPCPTFRPDHPEGLRPPQQLRFVFRQERRRQVAWAFPSAQEQAALHAAVAPSHSAPGVSVSPWARIEANTHSAARSKIRSPPAIARAEHEQRERHRRHALRPEPGHERLQSRRQRRCRRSASQIATGRATSSVTATIATAAQPSPNRPSSVSSEPKTTNTPSLTISTMSPARRSNVVAQVRRGGCRARSRRRRRR